MVVRCIVSTALLLLPGAAIAMQDTPAPRSLIDRLSEPLRAVPRHDGAARTTAPVDPGLAERVDAMVAADFPRFDRDGDGSLNRAEFGAWMATLRPDPGRGTASVSWIATAFADADRDHDDRLDRRELATFLVGAVGWRLAPGGSPPAGPAPSRLVKSTPAPAD